MKKGISKDCLLTLFNIWLAVAIVCLCCSSGKLRVFGITDAVVMMIYEFICLLKAEDQ